MKAKKQVTKKQEKQNNILNVNIPSISKGKKIKGFKAEELVVGHLIQIGYCIIERNYQIKGSEIDIIAQDGEWIVFVEVKSTFTSSTYSPYLAITKTKRLALKKGINHWLLKKDIINAAWRVDLAIFFSDSSRIEIYKHVTL